MKKSKLGISLVAAVSAAMMASTTNISAQSLDMTPSQVFTQIVSDMRANRVESAKALIKRLRSLGIIDIKIGDMVVSLATLEIMVEQNTSGNQVLIAGMATRAVNASFGYSPNFTGQNGFNQMTTMVSDSDPEDNFPTSSQG